MKLNIDIIIGFLAKLFAVIIALIFFAIALVILESGIILFSMGHVMGGLMFFLIAMGSFLISLKIVQYIRD